MKKNASDRAQNNIKHLRDLFPDCVTESRNEKGDLILAVDFDLLRQRLSGNIVEGPQERYRLDWPGKRDALLATNTPVDKTLRPCRTESVHFDSTRNLFIEGDNLDVLKLLQESYLAQIKLIYIDPPYNTGNDVVYRDCFSEEHSTFLERTGAKDTANRLLQSNVDTTGRFHSSWLSMMYPRLSLARNLLRNDGIALVSIDEKEHANLVKLGKLVFGEDNFCGEIVWKNSVKNDQRYISIQHEYLLVFVKSKQYNKGDWKETKEGLAEIYRKFAEFRQEHGDDWEKIHVSARTWYSGFPESSPIFSSRHYNWMDERGVYCPDNIAGPEDGQYTYALPHPVTGQPCKMPSSGWRYPKATMLSRIAENRIHFGPDHTVIPHNKTYLSDTEKQSLGSVRVVDGRGASRRLKKLFGAKVFTNPKDEFVLKDLFRAMDVSGTDIVLDFFAGSASTMHAVWELNKETGSSCRCILIQLAEDLHVIHQLAKGGAKRVAENAIGYVTHKGLPKNLCEIAKERLRLTRDKYGREWSGDMGFRVLKLDSSNSIDVRHYPSGTGQNKLTMFADRYKTDRTREDLLFQVLLDSGMDLSVKIRHERIANKDVYFMDEAGFIACFDDDLDERFARELVQFAPRRVVFRDSGIATDSARLIMESILKNSNQEIEISII